MTATDPHPPARKQRSPFMRAILFWVGIVLVLLTPVVGIIPGPGGVVVFAIGAGLVLQNSRWAKKKYVKFKTRFPGKGAWADWALRRPSYRRRSAIAEQAKTEQRAADPPDDPSDLRELEPGCKR